MKKRGYRTEEDYFGKKNIPSSAYFGIQTQRALENFAISGIHLQLGIIHAIAIIKKVATSANMAEKRLDAKKGKAILAACNDILKGKLDEQFKIDVFQAGAGTSEHMNVNEVIANRALEILGKKKGAYQFLHPNDDVNLGQSTNDVFHSAIHLAAYEELFNQLIPSLDSLEKELGKKSQQWKSTAKSGRTHLRDAVPMTLGQEFSGYASIIHNHKKIIEESSKQLLRLNLGGTAIGTSINAPLSFQKKMINELQHLTKRKYTQTSNLFGGTQSLSAIATVSGALKNLSCDLIKIANDIRLLSSGPTTGLNELTLPALQPGSSIMPGKVNPVLAEMLDMVCFQVIGNDTTIALCSQAGQLELNVMMPLAGYSLLHSIDILSNSIEVFSAKCIHGMKANEKKCKEYLEKNPVLVTALTPHIGYQKAAQIVKRAYNKNKSVRDIVSEEKLLDKKTLSTIFSLRSMVGK